MKSISVSDRIEFAAQSGAFEVSLYVWGNTAKKLVKDGLVLTETKIQSPRRGEKYYLISWADAKIAVPDGSFDYENIILENRKQGIYLNNAQILWLMATAKNRQ